MKQRQFQKSHRRENNILKSHCSSTKIIWMVHKIKKSCLLILDVGIHTRDRMSSPLPQDHPQPHAGFDSSDELAVAIGQIRQLPLEVFFQTLKILLEHHVYTLLLLILSQIHYQKQTSKQTNMCCLTCLAIGTHTSMMFQTRMFGGRPHGRFSYSYFQKIIFLHSVYV